MAPTTEQLWEAFHAPLLQFIRRRVADEATAEDLLQDVFLKIHQHGNQLREVKRLESWMYQLTRNCIIDYYRSQHQPMTPLEAKVALDLPDELPDDDIVSELLPSVRAMVLALPAQDRQALILTEYQGLTQKELGERLGLSFSGAKSRVQRAREKLKQQLLACCHFELDRRGHILNYRPRCACCEQGRACGERCDPRKPVRPFSQTPSLQIQNREKGNKLFLPSHTEGTTSMNTVPQHAEQLRQEVSARYARTALQVLASSEDHGASCCGSGCCTPNIQGNDPITSNLYTETDLGEIPTAAVLASLGCGNPTALAELREGEKVLDLGSGGGIDVLLSAKRVGPTGFAYGLDMTDAMLELAEHNRKVAGVQNVQFLKGIIEAIPLPDNAVDVVISNCVINLSADKRRVLREAYRVLTPGGRFAVSDIVVQGGLPPILRHDMESWAGCVAGALEEETYRALLRDAGFIDIEVEVTRRYSLDEIDQSGASASVAALSPEERSAVDGRFISAFVRARKPAKQEA